MSGGLLVALTSGNRPSGAVRLVAVVRLYAHLSKEVPLDYFLRKLDIPFREVSPLLQAQGIYEDEPPEVTVNFALRRTQGPPEARLDCEDILKRHPTLSRSHLVASALADWVGEEKSAHAVGLSVQAVRAYQRRLSKCADKPEG